MSDYFQKNTCNLPWGVKMNRVLQVQALEASIMDLRVGKEELEAQVQTGVEDFRDDDSAEGDEGGLCNVCATLRAALDICVPPCTATRHNATVLCGL